MWLTVRIGPAAFPADDSDAEGVIRAADEAMYRAKTGGETRWSVRAKTGFPSGTKPDTNPGTLTMNHRRTLMVSFRQQVAQIAAFLNSTVPDLCPDVGFLTGTGLSDTLTDLDIIRTWSYGDIPHFPAATVASHKGELAYGRLKEKKVLVFQGRFHLYEGYAPMEAAFPVRLLQELKVPVLILSNAAGGINLNFSGGDIMVIEDHINLTGRNPLLGPEIPEWGLRFPDMTRVYDPDLRALALTCAQTLEMNLQQGVYAGLLGPSLETPAETRFLKTIGADAVGFSTVMEAIAGVQAGMKILGLSLITNINDPDAPEQTTLEAVVETAAGASEKLNRLLSALIPAIGS